MQNWLLALQVLIAEQYLGKLTGHPETGSTPGLFLRGSVCNTTMLCSIPHLFPPLRILKRFRIFTFLNAGKLSEITCSKFTVLNFLRKVIFIGIIFNLVIFKSYATPVHVVSAA